jgi:hypothetical protein
METHVTGQPVLGELRQYALATLIGHPLFTEAEQLRANHFAHECEDIARLTRWAASVRVEITRREAEAARQRCHRATHEVLHQLRAARFRSHCPRSPRSSPAWVPGAPIPDQADRRADTFDQLAAARFLPADSLTFSFLLSRPSR